MGLNLRGVILQKYPSASAFAREVGWGRTKASGIMNGRVKPNADDMLTIAQAVGIDDANTFMAIFFPNYATK